MENGDIIIKFDDIVLIYNKIIDNKITRDKADRWAKKMVQLNDMGNLKFTPICDKDRIWMAIKYLYGIDIVDLNGNYINSNEQIYDKLEYFCNIK